MPPLPHIIPADHLPRTSRYGAMMKDIGHGGPRRGDGVLRREELEAYIEGQYNERNKLLAAHASTRAVDTRLRDAEEMLGDMLAKGADGLNYLPDGVVAANFRPELNLRVVEMLVEDDENRALDITQDVVDRARGRYMNMEARSMVELNSRERALNEIKEIANALGLI